MSKMVWERKQTFYLISNLFKETNLHIRRSFPHYTVLFVILGLLFFYCFFWSYQRHKNCNSLSCFDSCKSRTFRETILFNWLYWHFFLILKEAFFVYDLDEIFTTFTVFLSRNWRFKNTYLLFFKNFIESFPIRIKQLTFFVSGKFHLGRMLEVVVLKIETRTKSKKFMVWEK